MQEANTNRIKKRSRQMTTIVENSPIPLSATDGSCRPKISKDIGHLDNITNQVNLSDNYRTLHQTRAEHTFS